MGVVEVERQSPAEVSQASKEIIDPHDAATIDVLNWLANNDYIADSIQPKPGQLVKLFGSILLADGRLMKAASGSRERVRRK